LRAVQYLTGVKGVWNNITIKPKVAPTEVKEKIEAPPLSVTLFWMLSGSRWRLRGKIHPDRQRALLGRTG
jgi:hypothetical protein